MVINQITDNLFKTLLLLITILLLIITKFYNKDIIDKFPEKYYTEMCDKYIEFR